MKVPDELKSAKDNEFLRARLNIHFTHNYLKYHLLDVIKPIKLPLNQFTVLRILKVEYPENCSINGIKEQMFDKNSDVSRLVDRLLVKKLVVRKECKTDRRQKEIQITQRGIDLFKKINNHDDLLNSRINHLSLEEVTQLNNLLEKIRI
ncbi:MarR family winged helix-turn-helix transcriptional regulator [Lutibacter flavus]|uniref:DNA-binding transcriptional regulator, MarR family n=1 Tax=Lutibacter flavus TaxID=691689 RepID=A0A238VVB1_9FLAO|nr:MarR family transcriptional regulator [Lutibacter flavus]SNR38216.1 DNA-binding transcriptional regulator, MarR family [Lutibacter flavus]